MNPQVIMPADLMGRHNADLDASRERLEKGKQYQDLSTVIIVPTRGGKAFSAKWVQGMQALIRPMNNAVIGPIFYQGMEVGAAYNEAIKMIQGNPQLQNFKYMLAWEDDVIPQPDALMKLYENIDNFDVVGALYWTKGEGGQPMIYGDRSDPVLNFRPQIPNGGLHPCYGTGMGFTLFKLEQFKRIPYPWFETLNKWDPNTGSRVYTQDLNYYEKLIKEGGSIAVDCNAKAGHYSDADDILW